MASILRADHLTRVAGDKTLVADATFDVAAGEMLAIVGPSGSGKSSLLRLLNRLDEPSSGTVFVNGTDYRTIAPRQLRREIGMVTQRAFLFPGTVAENLRFGPAQRGEVLTDDAVDELLARAGMEGYASRTVANLSGGEQQRVSVARTLANQPLVLLADEPTSALDESSKAGIEQLVRSIVDKQHLTCVFVTHDTQQARRLADRVIVIESGRIVRVGAPREVLNA
jgi:putative ABC transport system ATP-binding protein